MESSNGTSKFGSNLLLIGLGLFTTSLLTALGIWGDDEISVRARMHRSISSDEYREEFSHSLLEAIEQKSEPRFVR